MATANFPVEILIDIFARLPTKSVGRCRCMAKQWRTLLSTPQFIKSHLTQETHKKNLILVSPSYSIHSITDLKTEAVSRRLEYPDSFFEVVGSCDGLVLLVNEEDEKCLVNPVTRQLVKIPDSPVAILGVHGFGYDRTNDDYKIVMVSCCEIGNEDEQDIGEFVDVYSVKTGVWKRVDSLCYDHAIPGLAPGGGAYMNGAIHWWGSGRESGAPPVIVAFNLADQVFDEIPAPSGVDVRKFVFNKLVALEGCLCIMDMESNDVWIMKDYGVRESWTKFGINVDYGWNLVKPLCFLGNDEILYVRQGKILEVYKGYNETMFVLEGETLVVYNVNDGNSGDMVVDGVSARFIDGCTFVESLVSPLPQNKKFVVCFGRASTECGTVVLLERGLDVYSRREGHYGADKFEMKLKRGFEPGLSLK